jgi:hypothetical protein
MYDIIELNAKKVPELKEIAKKLGVARAEKLKKQDLGRASAPASRHEESTCKNQERRRRQQAHPKHPL